MGKWGIILPVVLAIAMASTFFLPFTSAACTEPMEEKANFRVNYSTMYFEISAIAVGDMNGNGIPDIAVAYDNYISNSAFTLAVYEFNGTNFTPLGTIENFRVGTVGLMTVYPANTYMYDVDGDGKDELFIYGMYNGTRGIYVVSYDDGKLRIADFFVGSDSAILKMHGEMYLVVADSGIYAIKNGEFTLVPYTSFISYGLVRTGNFSRDANIAVLDGGTIHYYSFKNDTLRSVDDLQVNMSVSGWGNDVGYIDGFTKVHLVQGGYDSLFMVTYHNGYALVTYDNGSFRQISSGVLDGGGGNAMSAAAGRFLAGEKSDEIVVGFDNYIFSPLFKMYIYRDGNLSEVYAPCPEEGNTRVMTKYDLNGDGLDDVVLGAKNSGYVRVFVSVPGEEEESNVSLQEIFIVTAGIAIFAVVLGVLLKLLKKVSY